MVAPASSRDYKALRGSAHEILGDSRSYRPGEERNVMSEPTPNTGSSGSPAPAAAPKPVTAVSPTAPKPPPKPAAKPAKGKDRRFWLAAIVATPFAAAWTAMVASLGLMFLGTLRFLFPNVLSEPPSR